MPAFFFELSHPPIETAHFSSWWGGIQLREAVYDNAAIHDLYYLHEMYHRGAMPYATGLQFQSFAAKMQRNELEASVCTEIAVYFALPGLRAKAFSHPIYADRFLADPAYRRAWDIDPARLTEQFRVLRHSVMQTQNPNDAAEFWIRQYALQNEAWATIWVHRFDEVERAMIRLAERGQGDARGRALDDHVAWLRSAEVAAGGEIPFPEEANAFAGIYWLNKKHFQRAAPSAKPHAAPRAVSASEP